MAQFLCRAVTSGSKITAQSRKRADYHATSFAESSSVSDACSGFRYTASGIVQSLVSRLFLRKFIQITTLSQDFGSMAAVTVRRFQIFDPGMMMFVAVPTDESSPHLLASERDAKPFG